MSLPKESVVVSKKSMMEMLEEMFQIIWVNIGKALEYIPKLITSTAN